jgi:hypothetical protein
VGCSPTVICAADWPLMVRPWVPDGVTARASSVCHFIAPTGSPEEHPGSGAEEDPSKDPTQCACWNERQGGWGRVVRLISSRSPTQQPGGHPQHSSGFNNNNQASTRILEVDQRKGDGGQPG